MRRPSGPSALERVRAHAGQTPEPADVGGRRTYTVADRGLPEIEPGLPVVVTVRVSAACPTCGMARGKPESMTVHDWMPAVKRNGPAFKISRWKNLCSHADIHANVIEEAIRSGSYRRSVEPEAVA